MYRLFAFIFVSCVSFVALECYAMNTLSDLIYKQRVIIVDQQLVDIDTLSASRDALDDRRLSIFLVNGKRVTLWENGDVDKRIAEEIIARLGKQKGILIGLDGGTKMQFEALDLPDIFSTIDVMPMRQAELNQNND